MEKSILFVDDDLGPDLREPTGNYMWYYVNALQRRGFKVVGAQHVDKATAVLDDDKNDISLVVLDVMMPPGKKFMDASANNQGLRTGVLLAQHIAERSGSIPILVLTNVVDPETWADLYAVKSVRGCLSKSECTPFELVERIEDLLTSN